MKRYDQIIGLIWLVLGIGITINAIHLGLGTIRHPGVGFMSFLAGVLLGVSGFILSLWATLQGKEDNNKIWGIENWKNIVFPLLALFVYVFLFNFLGFILTTFLSQFLLLKMTEPRKWLAPFITSVIVVFISYYIFSVWLNISFPKGFFGSELRGGFMDFIANLSLGYDVAFSLVNLFYCFLGVLFGTLVGVLPGLGPATTIALLLPVTFGMKPVSGIIMLAGIYYGAQYGGSTTSILINIPGETSSVVTCLDGYQMARQGRAGPALGIAAFGSFIAGTLALIPLTILAVPLSNVAIEFGPPEYFAVIVLGLIFLINLVHGSIFKGFIMAILGIALSQIGMDIITGQTRLTFGIMELQEGIGLVPLFMGLFGVGEILTNLSKPMDVQVFKTKITGLLPGLEDWRNSLGAICRGTFLGFFLGLLPGGGGVLASFTAYAVEKRISRQPEKFGTGAIEGVAGPESANNAAASSNFIPLFVLGIPANASMALLMGCLMIHNVVPGPFLVSKHPDIFWGTVVSMYIGNAVLLILNLPLIPLWVRLLRVPYRILFPSVLLVCVIGVYSIDNSIFDILLLVIFGFMGFLLRKFKYELAPLVLAFILGPIAETSLRQSLLMSNGNLMIFISRPIPLIGLLISVVLIITSIWSFIRRQKKAV